MADQGKADLSFADRLLQLEADLTGKLAQPLTDALQAAARATTAAYVRAFGSIDAAPTSDEAMAAVVAVFTDALQAVPVDLRAALLEAAGQGFDAGVAHTVGLLTEHDDPAPGAVRKSGLKPVTAQAKRADRAVLERLAKTVALAGKAGKYSDLVSAFADGHMGVSIIRREVVAAVFNSASSGVSAATKQAGIGSVWVAERDACLHCTGHAGHIVGPGVKFPAGLTYDASESSPFGAVTGPQLHPHCRCTLSPWSPKWAGRGTSYPEVLRREAKRSVLQGRRLPSESGNKRLAAADALLKKPGALTRAPKAVKNQARAAVRRGEFLPRPDPKRAAENRRRRGQ